MHKDQGNDNLKLNEDSLSYINHLNYLLSWLLKDSFQAYKNVWVIITTQSKTFARWKLLW
mgnify:CR=1 FL=1